MATTATHVWRPSGARRVVLDGFVSLPRGTIPTTPAPLNWPAKDPGDILDYEFDASAALIGNPGDSITTLDVVIAPNAAGDLTLNSATTDGPIAVFWFAHGQIGTVYVVQVTIGTSSGRTINRAVLLPVQSLATSTAPASMLTSSTGAAITDQNGNPIVIGS